jgi:CheY-like chemotaxis protein
MKKKILIIDDDIDVINVYKAILEKEGYTVLTAHNKKTGLNVCRVEMPALIILDVMMTTHYEGFELRKELQEDAQLRNIPVIIQTSIDVLTTSDGQKESIVDMAYEFRINPDFKDLQVLLIKNLANNMAGVDYINENGKNIYFEVEGFLRKPVKAANLLAEVRRFVE